MKLEQKDFSFFKHFDKNAQKNHEQEEAFIEDSDDNQHSLEILKADKQKKRKKYENFFVFLLIGTIIATLTVGVIAPNSPNKTFIDTNKTLVYQLLSPHSRFDTFSDIETSIFKKFQEKEISTQFLFANEKLLALKAKDGSHYKINISTITPTYYQIEYTNLNNVEYEWTDKYFEQENFPNMRLDKFAYPSKNKITIMLGNMPELSWPTISVPDLPPIKNTPSPTDVLIIPPQAKPIEQSNDGYNSGAWVVRQSPNIELPLPPDTTKMEKYKLEKQMDELNRQSIHDSMQNMPVYEQRQMDAKTMIRLQQQLELARELTNTIAK